MGYCGAVMINRSSPRREQALDFIRYMAGREFNELINHQADGLGPVKKFVDTDAYLHDPAFPEEDFNQVWRETMELGEPQETCEFVNGAVAERIISTQLDLVRSNQKPAAAAMQAAARQINEQIDKKLRSNKVLKRRYDAIQAAKSETR